MRKVWLTAFIVLASLCATPAFAACDERPTFNSPHDPTAVPGPPKNANTLPAIEAFRLALETFRGKEIEGYNADLKVYVASLVAVDNKARELAAGGRCSIAEYSALRDHVDKEFAKSGDVYLDRYWKGLTEYRAQIAWCESHAVQTNGDAATPDVS
jgi:hypothetical protein